MTEHALKILPIHFDAIDDGTKRAELRYDDRGFAVGDVISLNEWNGDTGYSGRQVRVRVTHILRDFKGLADGFVMLSFVIVPHTLEAK